MDKISIDDVKIVTIDENGLCNTLTFDEVIDFQIEEDIEDINNRFSYTISRLIINKTYAFHIDLRSKNYSFLYPFDSDIKELYVQVLTLAGRYEWLKYNFDFSSCKYDILFSKIK